MKKTILLSNHYDEKPFTILQSIVGEEFELKMLSSATQECLEASVRDADYLLVSGRLYIGESVIKNAPRLKMIQRTGVGMDNMDLECFRKHQIPLYVNAGVNAVSVAEHTVMLMLATLRKAYKVNNQLRSGVWKKQATGLTTHELRGKKVGIVGMGTIGKHVVEMLSGFGVEILYFDMQRLSAEQEQMLGVVYTDLKKLLAQVDIITLHCPANGQYLLDFEEFACMKDGVIIINTARGSLIHTNALVDALKTGKVSGCGIDTYESEPVDSNHPLLEFENAILSPHIAGVTYESFHRMLACGIENIKKFDSGNEKELEEYRVW